MSPVIEKKIRKKKDAISLLVNISVQFSYYCIRIDSHKCDYWVKYVFFHRLLIHYLQNAFQKVLTKLHLHQQHEYQPLILSSQRVSIPIFKNFY